MKPSERLLERTQQIHQEQLGGYYLSTPRPGEPDESHRAILLAHAVRRAVGEALDAFVTPLHLVCDKRVSDAERARLEQLGATLLPEGVRPLLADEAGPIPCKERPPQNDKRVMFFVPSEPEGWRWRTGSFEFNRSTHGIWTADDSSSGDSAIEFKPEQVTHWLPLPEEPRP